MDYPVHTPACILWAVRIWLKHLHLFSFPVGDSSKKFFVFYRHSVLSLNPHRFCNPVIFITVSSDVISILERMDPSKLEGFWVLISCSNYLPEVIDEWTFPNCRSPRNSSNILSRSLVHQSRVRSERRQLDCAYKLSPYQPATDMALGLLVNFHGEWPVLIYYPLSIAAFIWLDK